MKTLLTLLLLIPSLSWGDSYADKKGVIIVMENPASITVGLSMKGRLSCLSMACASKLLADVATNHCKKFNKFPVMVSEKTLPGGYPDGATFLRAD